MIVPPSYERFWLAWDCNFMPFDDLRADPAVDDGSKACYKFVSPDANSRVLIQIDRDEMTP